jgi:hypothetical protein
MVIRLIFAEAGLRHGLSEIPMLTLTTSKIYIVTVNIRTIEVVDLGFPRTPRESSPGCIRPSSDARLAVLKLKGAPCQRRNELCWK